MPAHHRRATFHAAASVSRDNSQWSPRRAEPGQWLLRGLVKCGACAVGTNCHKMRGRNGTWHRYYYCRNHDLDPRRRCRTPLPRTQHPRRRPRHVRLRPGPRRPATPRRAPRRRTGRLAHTPTPDDELLAAELARLDRRLDATDAERRRLADLYQTGLLDLTELQRRAADVDHRRNDLNSAATPSSTNAASSPATTSYAPASLASPDASSPSSTSSTSTKQQLLRLVVEEVRVTGWNVQIQLRIPLDAHPDTRPDRPSRAARPDQPPGVNRRRSAFPW